MTLPPAPRPPAPDPANRREPPAGFGPVRRMGSAAGFLTIAALDLLALDDITTAGAWMPEIAMVLVSIPALLVLAWFVVRPSPAPPDSE